jgi:tetratricopeptide (TPR) repeat protein
MRGLLQSADLTGYAGQFVWLELNFDKAENKPFFTKYGAIATPTFYIIDPQNRRVAASQTGAMSLAELKQFLDRGASSVARPIESSADAALARGDRLLAQKPNEAAAAYREALRAAPSNWTRLELAEASLTVALQDARQWQDCANTAVTQAAHMKGHATFGRTVVAGMWCVVSADPAPWSTHAAAKLEPLAKEALAAAATVRDHRDELYRTLMYLCLSRDDKACAADWGNRWLEELETRKPRNDEDRSAIDIARVENVQTFGDPKRILPALIASERAMPGSWNASLRVAQMEGAAKNYDESIAACVRGLARHPGPAGRSWLLRTTADALNEQGRRDAARQALRQALAAAKAIPNPQTRDGNVNAIKSTLERWGRNAKN